jgi:hypothetical protein
LRHPLRLASLLILTATAPAFGQTPEPKAELHFTSRHDSLDWVDARKLAERSTGFRIIVSLQAHHIWVVAEDDTLLSAPAAVAKGTALNYEGRGFVFNTPRGMRRVMDKSADPIWNPPDWLYLETAKEYGLKTAYIPDKGTVTTSDGRKLFVEDNRVKVIDDEGVSEFDPHLHLIFGETLYIPPIGTDNRRIAGTLGKYKLNLGEGYMLHGTIDQATIGMAATHGCVRLHDEDIEWLYDNVSVGTKVYIY